VVGLASGVAIAAASRVESTAGPRAGLFAWRKVADGATSGEVRALGLLGAMGCALSLRDQGAMLELVRLWPLVDEGVWDARVIGLCKDAVRAGMLGPATELIACEAARTGTARALYVYARCLETAGDARAPHAFVEAGVRADKEGAADLARASRVRRVAWLSGAAETRGAAIDEAKAIDARDATPDERLVLARILLGGGSRFVRASGLALLDELVTRDTRADEALRMAARHADDLGEGITPMEVDRLLALFSREPVAVRAAHARDAVRALDRIARARTADDAAFDVALGESANDLPELARLHQRARDILAGRFEPHAAHGETRGMWEAMLDAVVALRDGAFPRAALSLRRIADAPRIFPQAWTVVQLALATEDAEVRAAAGALANVMLLRAFGQPPRGWLAVTQALAGAGLVELADVARRNAAVAKEPGATAALALTLTRAGWQLAGQGGQRAQALAKLREAKALSEGRADAPAPGATSPSR
jgi:hypothetical protein